MNKAKAFYDVLSVIVIFSFSLLISALIFSSGQPGKANKLIMVGVIVAIIIIFYSIAIVILGIRKSGKFSHGLAIFIGSVLLPGLLPLIYYFTYLRARIDAPPIHEQFQKLVKRIQKAPEQFQELT